MIYFYNSSRKDDKIKNPITIVTNSLRRAEAIAVIKFKEWGYKGSPIRIALMLLLMLCMTNVNAQTYTREGNTFISSTGERKSNNNAIETSFKVKESDGKQYIVYCSRSTGACFIKKVSRNGNEYKKYLGEDISKQICKEIGVEYKSRKRNAS